MTTYSADLDLAAVLAPPTRCPTCAARLDPVRQDAELDFGCRACGSRWHVELGHVHQVPSSCRWG